MPGNRSLDEFAAGSDPSGSAGVGDEPDRTADPEESVEPMAETFAWSADGGPCARCGETADARWRDDGDLVCADCKPW